MEVLWLHFCRALMSSICIYCAVIFSQQTVQGEKGQFKRTYHTFFSLYIYSLLFGNQGTTLEQNPRQIKKINNLHLHLFRNIYPLPTSNNLFNYELLTKTGLFNKTRAGPFSKTRMLFDCTWQPIRSGSEEASQHMKKRWREQAEQRSIRQNSIGCITITFSVQYSQPACWYVGVGDCGTMRTCRVLQSNYYTREYCCHDKRKERRDGECWVMTVGQFLFFLQSKKKRVYTFAEREERGNNRWVGCLQFSAPNQTSSEITLYSQ